MTIQPSLPIVAGFAGTSLAQSSGADRESHSATAAAARRAEAPAGSTDTLALNEGANVGDREGDGRSAEGGGEQPHQDAPAPESPIEEEIGPGDLRGRGRRLDLHG